MRPDKELELEQRIEALETKKIQVKDLPISALQRRLAADPQDVNELILPGSISPGFLHAAGNEQVTSLAIAKTNPNDRYVLRSGALGWDVIYTGDETYPWLCLGGYPFASVAGGGAVVEPGGFSLASITVPFSMEARITWGCESAHQTPTNLLTEIQLRLLQNGVLQDVTSVVSPSIFVGGPLYGELIRTIKAGEVFQMFWLPNNTGQWSVSTAWIYVEPLRFA